MTNGGNNGGPLGPGPGFGGGNSGGNNPQNAGMGELIRAIRDETAGSKGGKINPGAAPSVNSLTEKQFRGVADRLGDRLSDLRQLIKSEAKNGASQNEIDKLVKQLKDTREAVGILRDAARKRYGRAQNVGEKARWDRLRERLEKFLEDSGKNDAPNGGRRGGWSPPSQKPPRQPKPPRGPGRPSKTDEYKDMDELIKKFRGVADSKIAGDKGWAGNPYSADDVRASMEKFREDFSRDFNANRGNMGSENDENALIAKFSYAMRRFEIALREENKGVDKMNLGNIANIALNTLGGSRILNKLIFDDPMKYRTMPAIAAMGTTGKMGSALAGAASEYESYRNERNQSLMNAGFGVMGAGLGGMFLARQAGAGAAALNMGGKFKGMGKAGTLLGGALAIGGAAAAGIGAHSGITDSNIGANMWDKMAGKVNGVTSTEVFQTSLASAFNKPEEIIKRLDLSKQVARTYGMEGAGKLGGDAFGNYSAEKIRGGGTLTGNALFDKLSADYNGMSMARMGYGASDMASFMSQIGNSLNGKSGDAAIGLSRYAATKAAAFGGDASSIIEMMSTAQGAGGKDLRGMVNNNLAAAADKSGQLDQFAINVIAPAVGRVTQSIAVKNVSMSADKLNEQVSSLYRSFSSGALSGTNLGQLVKNSPELLGQLLGNFGSAAQAFTSTEEGFYEYQRLGLNPVDYARGVGNSPEGLKKYLEAAYSYYQVGNNIEGTGKDARIADNAYLALTKVFENTGLDRQTNEQLLINMHQNGGKLDIGNSKDLKDVVSKVNGNTNSNLGALNNSTAAEIQENMVKQQDMFEKTVMGISDKIKDSQEAMNKALNRPDFMNIVEAGITRIDANLQDILNALPGSSKPAVGGAGSYGDKPIEGPAVPPGLDTRSELTGQLQNSGASKGAIDAISASVRVTDDLDTAINRFGKAGEAYKKHALTTLGESGGTGSGNYMLEAGARGVKSGNAIQSQRAMDGGFLRRSKAYNALQGVIDTNKTDGKVQNIGEVGSSIAKFAGGLDLLTGSGNQTAMNANSNSMTKIVELIFQKFKDPAQLQALVGATSLKDMTETDKKYGGKEGGYLRQTLGQISSLKNNKNTIDEARTLTRELLMSLGVDISGTTTIENFEKNNKLHDIGADKRQQLASRALIQGEIDRYGTLIPDEGTASGDRKVTFGVQDNGDVKAVTVTLRKGMSRDELQNMIAEAIYKQGIGY